MKKLLCFMLSTCIGYFFANAQTNIFPTTGSAGIGTVAPNAKAALEVVSTTQGVLLPRMTTAQRNAILTPPLGLLIYQIDGTKGLYQYNGTAWAAVTTAIGSLATKTLNNLSAVAINASLTPGTTGTLDLGSATKAWRNGFFSGSVGIGNTAPAALLDVNGDALINTVNVGQGGGNIAGNTVVGYQSFLANSTGLYNTAHGYQTLFSNTTGSFNNATGYQAMYFNTDGINNTANGGQSLFSNSLGNGNTAMGFATLASNTSGYSNVGLGTFALYSNTDRNNLVAIGDSALYNNGTGAVNSYEAIANTAVGSKTLFTNTTGYSNTANGFQALYLNTSGAYNTANGASALYSNTYGYYNTSNGANALYSNTTGYYNTANGGNALSSNITGHNNTALGFSANVSAGDLINATAIGFNAVVNASNKMQLGASTTTLASTGGITIVSDGRFKDNVKTEDVPGLAFINNLNPVAYNFNYKSFDDFLRKDIKNTGSSASSTPEFQQLLKAKSQTREVGFIAQEVNKLVKDKGYTFNGVYTPQNANDNYALDYSRFVVPLVKAVQELSIKNDELGMKNDKLTMDNGQLKANDASLQKQIDDLKTLMQQLLNNKSTAPCPPLAGK